MRQGLIGVRKGRGTSRRGCLAGIACDRVPLSLPLRVGPGNSRRDGRKALPLASGISHRRLCWSPACGVARLLSAPDRPPARTFPREGSRRRGMRGWSGSSRSFSPRSFPARRPPSPSEPSRGGGTSALVGPGASGEDAASRLGVKADPGVDGGGGPCDLGGSRFLRSPPGSGGNSTSPGMLPGGSRSSRAPRGG